LYTSETSPNSPAIIRQSVDENSNIKTIFPDLKANNFNHATQFVSPQQTVSKG